MKKLIIGTRGSLLARTQSSFILSQLEKLSGANVELKKITTQGDQITNVPLWQLDGKDFFTKELDEALLAGEVDLLVHSYKDLGTKRPSGIKLGAITERVFPEDVLLIKQETIGQLKNLDEITVGTSSPRRIALLESGLSEFLPHSPKVKTKFLRGNVNTRIQKLRDGEYHAICLAFAGMERLTYNEESLSAITNLVDGLNFMILPPSNFPPAASQGALAIECLEKRDDDLHELLEKLHHLPSAEAIGRERKAFESYGGGCHLPVGIHVKHFSGSYLHIHKGEYEDKPLLKTEIENLALPKLNGKLFIGMPKQKAFLENENIIWDEYIEKKIIPTNVKNVNDHFITSSYCLDSMHGCENRLWSSGTRTWKQMAKKGYWVNGSSDGMGHDVLKKYESSALLPLFNGKFEWQVLSHSRAESVLGEVLGVYDYEFNDVSADYWDKLKEAEAFYWTSYQQYNFYKKHLPNLDTKKHFSGMGKTYTRLKEEIEVTPLASMKQLSQLI